ncbi:MAG: hypothetical protein ACYDG6_12635 [Thermincolia bacterium]
MEINLRQFWPFNQDGVRKYWDWLRKWLLVIWKHVARDRAVLRRRCKRARTFVFKMQRITRPVEGPVFLLFENYPLNNPGGRN